MQRIKLDLRRKGSGKVFFIGDTHFGHKNIIKYSDRPFDTVREMDEALIQNWNSVVSPQDTVFHLGDFFFAQGSGRDKMAEESWRMSILRRLNGQIHLVIGNHDEHLKRDFLPGKMHDIYRLRVLSNILGSEMDHTFFLCHYAMRTWPGKHKGVLHLYGHSHGNLPGFGNSMDVGVDCHNSYRPFSLEEVYESLFGAWFKSRSLRAGSRPAEAQDDAGETQP
jgi:calcineurin-like phosphoesterase family protein